MPSESPERLIRQLREGRRGGAFFLHGEEAYLKEVAVRELIEAHLEPGSRTFNLDEVRADEATPETLGSLIQTPPMMGDWRVVVVRNAEALSSSPTTRALMEEATGRTPPGLVLVLVADIGGSKAKIWKTVQKQATAVAFPRLSDEDLPGWLMRWAEREGLRLEPDAARALAAAIGSDLATLVRELEKLREYVGDRDTIQRKDVESVVGVIARQDRWEWFDIVGGRDFIRARRTLPILLEAGESGVGLVIGLGQQLLRIGLVAAGGKSALDAALPRNQKWLSGRIAGQARGWSPGQVRLALRHLSRADRLLKSAPLSDAQIMEELLLRLEHDPVEAA